jgi:hypothetical protein
MSNCIHGLGQGECAYCGKNTEKKNMYFVPQLISKINNNEHYGLVLSYPDTSEMINVMWLQARNHFEEINKEDADIQYASRLPIFEQNRLKQNFRKIALYKGSLFIPRRPLAQTLITSAMEKPVTTEIGESNCWSCGRETKLSYNRGSIGCNRCKAYVCLCGHCMCDFPVRFTCTYPYVLQQPGLPCNLAARREYVKIVKAFSSIN